MKIQVLGSGCSACKKLFELTKEAVKQLNLKDEVEYITDVSKIIEMGVMSSPVLAIDGKPALVGFLPDIEKIKSLLNTKTEVEICGDDCDCEKKPSACSCKGKC